MTSFRSSQGNADVLVGVSNPLPVAIPAYTSSSAASTVTVATSSTVIFAAGNRRRIILQNQDSTNPVFLSFSGSASVSGIRLAAGQMFDLQGWSGVVNGIATGGSVTVAKAEFL